MKQRVSESELPLFTWQPPEPGARIVAFPVLRRHNLAKRHAERMINWAPAKVKTYVDKLILQMQDTMMRKGIRQADAARETAALLGAIVKEYKARGGSDLWA